MWWMLLAWSVLILAGVVVLIKINRSRVRAEKAVADEMQAGPARVAAAINAAIKR